MSIYSETLPRSQQETYSSNTTVDFLLRIPQGFDFVKGSLRFTCLLNASIGGAYIPFSSQVYMNKDSGAHSLLDNWVCQFKNGKSEYRPYYPRYVAMHKKLSKNDNDKSCSNSSNKQLQMGDEVQTTAFLCNSHDDREVPIDIKPEILVNMSNRDFSAEEVGSDIEISCRIRSFQQCFYSAGVNLAAPLLELKNIRLEYKITPSQKHSTPLVFNKIQVVKNNLSSNKSYIEIPINTLTKSISSSFISAVDESDPVKDNGETQKLPGLSQVRMLKKDQQGRITYNLNNDSEILHNYYLAMGGNQSQSKTQRYTDIDSNFGIGMMANLSEGKISYELNSLADVNNKYSMISYLKSPLVL